jgi:hypothetical protein
MLVLWGARAGDVQVGSREDRDSRPPWPGFDRWIAGLQLNELDERFIPEPWQREVLSRFYRAHGRAVQYVKVGKR